MHNNTQHLFITKYTSQPKFYVVFCVALLSSTTIATAQDTFESTIFPPVPQLSSSNTVLPEIAIQKEKKLPLEIAVVPKKSDAENAVTTSSNALNDAQPVFAKTSVSTRRPPSYGNWSTSLMFPEQEIRYMKTILDEYEATGEVPLSLQDIPDIVVEEVPTVEITEYPSFHLKSILYHSPKYWGVWINDIKITSRDNHSSDAEIKVVNVSKENVRFRWRPSDPAFMDAFTKQLPNLKEIAADTVLPIANRTSHSARPATISEDKTSLYFSLRLNESFSTETFYTFDGKPPTLVYPSLDVPYNVDGTVTPALAEIPADISSERQPTRPQSLDEILDQIEASKNTAAPERDNINKVLDQQSPKELLESMTPDAALKAIEAITK